MEDLDQELDDMSEDLSFKNKVLTGFIEKELSALRVYIQSRADAGYRNCIINLQDRDIKKMGFLWRRSELVGYGKMIWNQLIQLGFEPILELNYQYIKIEW